LQASPRSLATTWGISVDFFSSSYLDVSVRSVRLHWPMYSAMDTLAGGFPHSDIYGSKLVCELPVAFRTLQRPSSPVIAKASTTCTYSLDPITLNSGSSDLAATSTTSVCSVPLCFAFGTKDCNHYPCLIQFPGLNTFTSSKFLKIQTAFYFFGKNRYRNLRFLRFEYQLSLNWWR
jgi:hypothetical protein